MHYHKFNNVKKSDELKNRAQKYLNTHAKVFPDNIVVKAIDLQLIGESNDPIELGDKVKVVSTPHGLSTTMACIKMELDIQNPENNSYTIGTIMPPDKEKKKESLSEKQNSSSRSSSRGIGNNRNDIEGLMGDMDAASNNINVNAENIAIIGSYGFYNCTNLRTVNLGPYVTELYRGVFRGCTSLESVELSANITEIPYECFYECSSLGEITLDRNITVIRENAFVGCTNLVIRCYYDSCAHNFAKAQDIPYILLDSVLLGDANGDGYVNISDVTDIQRAVAEMDTLDDLRKKAADINGDGVVTIDDATFLQTYLAEFETTFPIGEVA